jgi:hypothetical protein
MKPPLFAMLAIAGAAFCFLALNSRSKPTFPTQNSGNVKFNWTGFESTTWKLARALF